MIYTDKNNEKVIRLPHTMYTWDFYVGKYLPLENSIDIFNKRKVNHLDRFLESYIELELFLTACLEKVRGAIIVNEDTLQLFGILLVTDILDGIDSNTFDGFWCATVNFDGEELVIPTDFHGTHDEVIELIEESNMLEELGVDSMESIRLDNIIETVRE